jgi:ubiquinone/menaquinone biosynthesis C-methylase UbiE
MKSPYAEIYRRALSCKEFEPVPGDFLMKITSMDILSDLIGLGKRESVLEIGCGCGFNAALLSSSCGSLVATDLPFYDPNTHSLGISVARKLLANLGVKNAELVSCSGESLPFADATFDMVFSSSVLEHIDDKEKALKEMVRVVKPGGTVIFIIPTFIQSICAFAHLYLYIGKRVIDVASARLFRKREEAKKGLLPKTSDSTRPNSAIIGSFWDNHPSFPLPQPHGAYKNIAVEFIRQLPWNWIKLAKRCGASSVDTCAMLFLPFNILEVFSTKLIARSYSATRYLHKALGKTALQYLSYAWCVAIKK